MSEKAMQKRCKSDESSSWSLGHMFFLAMAPCCNFGRCNMLQLQHVGNHLIVFDSFCWKETLHCWLFQLRPDLRLAAPQGHWLLALRHAPRGASGCSTDPNTMSSPGVMNT